MKKEKDKESYAVALKYDGENSPKLTAKATGLLAEKIIASAKEHNIHIHNDPILLSVLSRLNLGDEIPKSLYLAVAKIIAFAYFLQGKHPNNANNKQKHEQGDKQDLLPMLNKNISETKDIIKND